jgi:hypothetical protein
MPIAVATIFATASFAAATCDRRFAQKAAIPLRRLPPSRMTA